MFHSSNNNNNNGRTIPTVGAHLSRSRHSGSSVLERKLQQAEKRMENCEGKLARLMVKFDEYQAKHHPKPADKKKPGFPGSKDEKRQVRVSINAHYLNDSSL